MSSIQSMAGAQLAIGGVANSDLDQAGFEALTWLDVLHHATLPAMGNTETINAYSPLNGVDQHFKGNKTAGNNDFEYRVDVDSTGQDMMRTAGASNDDYAIRVTMADGTATTTPTIFYSRAKVAEVRQKEGGDNDPMVDMTTLGFNQAWIRVAPTAIP